MKSNYHWCISWSPSWWLDTIEIGHQIHVKHSWAMSATTYLLGGKEESSWFRSFQMLGIPACGFRPRSTLLSWPRWNAITSCNSGMHALEKFVHWLLRSVTAELSSCSYDEWQAWISCSHFLLVGSLFRGLTGETQDAYAAGGRWKIWNLAGFFWKSGRATDVCLLHGTINTVAESGSRRRNKFWTFPNEKAVELYLRV